MELSIENIASHYAKMRDQELIRVATQDAQGLRPEVFGIIENELKKRNLDLNIMKGVEAQNKQYTLAEIQSYAEIVRDIPCPICNQSNEKLNATILYTVKSIIIVTNSEKKPIVACPTCLDKKNNSAIISTLLWGWWGIPWGIFKTVQYLIENVDAKKENHSEISNHTLLTIVLNNMGTIEAYKNDKIKLVEFFKNQML